ncbi:MAG TPA: carboxymuconolactone decarboxylase family protein [Flexivirga sp.]|uniref:carboxymuconolactone decarboxylase family protein n=1 Tax=Flexivirga sp. TaxID=1962927 RepID=UPI002C0F6F4C|nr:carboxymuconolactone decarboxylase family protein [Flexivirga sp.]HWC22750.1 carboxymuconolactone decarboxylase family protein [Flexivirga sp.]
MTRVPPATSDGPVAQRIRERRGGTLTPLDQALLHSEAFADGWNALLGAVRSRMDLPGHLRELVICRIAALNGAEYEWRAHAPLALHEGLTAEQVAALQPGADPAPLNDLHRLVIDYTDAMTHDVTVPDRLSDALHELLGTQQLVELTGTIAAYNMVSRFLVALHVGQPRIEEGEVPA